MAISSTVLSSLRWLMAVLPPAPLRATPLEMQAMAEVRVVVEDRHLRRMVMGDRVVVTWVAEEGAALVAVAISDGMETYRKGSGGEVNGSQNLDTVDTEAAGDEVEVAIDSALWTPNCPNCNLGHSAIQHVGLKSIGYLQTDVSIVA